MRESTRRRPAAARSVVAAALAAGALAAGLLAASTAGTAGGFAATVQNSGNTAGSGVLTMQEQNSGATATCTSIDSTTVSTNAATCTSINAFGGAARLVPGRTVSTSVTITNTGTADAASFTLTPGACTSSGTGSATDLCSRLTVVVTSGATTLYSGTLAAMSSPIVAPALPAGASAGFTFAVTLQSGLGSTYQGLTASMPLTWAFGS